MITDRNKREQRCIINIVDTINAIYGKATINSLKKNTLPDLARAGFIERFKKNILTKNKKKSCV